MPNRMIRDEILESERVLSLPADVRWFFLSVLLTADDLGLFEATDFKLARRATLSPDQAGRFLSMLVDADLVRMYVVERRRYGFIPRFRQKLQIRKSKCPLPPASLFSDDEDMQKKAAAVQRGLDGGIVGAFGKEWDELRQQVFARDGFACIRCRESEGLHAHHLKPQSDGGEHVLSNLTTLCASCNAWVRNNAERVKEIKDLALGLDAAQMLGSIAANAGHRPESESEEKKKEYQETSSRSLVAVAGAAVPPPMPDCPHLAILALWAESLPALPQHSPDMWNGARAKSLRQRWRETATRKGWKTPDEGLAYFRRLFAYVGKSRFLTGQCPPREQGGEPFAATLEFIVTASKWRRLHEGAYHRDEATA
jgi:hypothetical protein